VTSPQDRLEQIQRIIVTAEQMRSIESRIFAAGMPIAALMEKVAGRIAHRIQTLYPLPHAPRLGVLVGTGHNGGDALVVARELHFQGYEVSVCCPVPKLKDLTAHHFDYVKSLGIPCQDSIDPLQTCDLLIDGLFGFGLERSLSEPFAPLIDQINQWQQPILSIDLPSGLHTDTGQILGTAVQATHTFCLGLWKLGLLQEQALEYVGKAELIDFDIPVADIFSVLGNPVKLQRGTAPSAIATLPLSRPPSTHKYKMGHLLLICGSRRYAGGALLTGLGARASGVGMLSIAVPESLKSSLSAQLPDALIIGCPETPNGAIAQLPIPPSLHSTFNAIACGPGLTTEATAIVQQVLASACPLVLDADGLNILAQQGTIPTLQNRQASTILTPHLGEFKRLFPEIAESMACRVTAVQTAATQTGAIVLLKGARVAIADLDGNIRINPASTPALARGGSGDVLTGLMGGLLAQKTAAQTPTELIDLVQTAAWWHSQAGILAAQERTELGVDAHTLTQYLIPALRSQIISMN
jgi:ADP-dependent NAD(P)H-hydrate dehydratase / NAD(P)H-hydrate epimerase